MTERTRETFKTVTWFVLIAAGIAATVWMFDTSSVGRGIATGILTAFVWAAVAAVFSFVFSVRRPMKRHLNLHVIDATFQEKEIAPGQLVDVRRTLERLYAEQSETGGARFGMGLNAFVDLATIQSQNLEKQTLQWMTFESLPGSFENLPTNAVYLLKVDDEPFVATIPTEGEVHGDEFDDAPMPGNSRIRLQILSRSIEAGTGIINHLIDLSGVHSVYRGLMLEIGSGGDAKNARLIRISHRPRVDVERIVLPQDVMSVVQRSVAGRLKYHRLLERHGHLTKTGVLLFGSPGTGKTLVARHLIGSYEGYTAIVPRGMESRTIREAFRLAGYLAPAMIVVEDVDLLAERRESNANVTGLQELMNEMDGLAPSSETIVLMTTNRPELLEPALASRPGRVSQAIEFPLPDDALRGKLLQLFCVEAEVSRVDFDLWVERTNGASPAFLEELVRRAMIFAAERIGDSLDQSARLSLVDVDFDRAIHELVVSGGELTTRILGYGSPPDDSE